MNLVLRLETPEDYRAVENLTREAFWSFPGRDPGCDEHLLAHKMRSVPAFVPELDYVAIDGDTGEIVGNILYVRCQVTDETGTEHTVLTFGPLSVLPEYQNRGVGGALARKTIEEARRLGYKGIIIFGHPAYYPRFGFVPAEVFGITTADGKNFDAFMALELREGALAGVSGRYCEDPVYHLDPAEVAEFEKGFLPK